MKQSRDTAVILADTTAHFCVDYVCMFMLYSSFRGAEISVKPMSVAFLAFNILAFGFLPFLGYLCDNYPRLPLKYIGIIVLIGSVFLMKYPWLVLPSAVIGSACFHSSAGGESLRHGRGGASASGFFISTGIFGAAVGGMMGRHYAFTWAFSVMILSLSVLFMVFADFPPKKISHEAHNSEPDTYEKCFSIASSRFSTPVIILLALAAVIFRSYMTVISPVAWTTGIYTAILPSAAIGAGRLIGGILSDKLGAQRVGIFSVVLAAPLLIFGHYVALLSIVGHLLLAFGTPAFLLLVAQHFDKHPSLAFGISSFSMMLGFLPSCFTELTPSYAWMIIIPLSLATSAILYLAVSRDEDRGYPPMPPAVRRCEAKIKNFVKSVLGRFRRT